MMIFILPFPTLFSGKQVGPSRRPVKYVQLCCLVPKVVKSVKNVFDTFRQFSRGTFFPAPFRGLRIVKVRADPLRKAEIKGLGWT